MTTTTQKLHIGCFDRVLPGWINTDITPHIFLSRVPGLPALLFMAGLLPKERYEQHARGVFRSIRYMNVVKQFPFADNTIDCVYSSHMIEHLYPKQADFCFHEIYRVLKPGGLLRVSVPDLDKIVAGYDSQRPEPFLEDMYETKQKHEKNRHHWHYSEASLRRKLSEVGFSEIQRCRFRQGRCPDIALHENRPESLFVEAVK
jgi:predicted SAM-dependent methyltransferase